MDGIKNAAMFLCGLEWNTVDLLLGRLDPEAAKAVRREMMSLGHVSPRESTRVAREFLRAAGMERRGAQVHSVIEHRVAAPSGTYIPPVRKSVSPGSAPPRFSFDEIRAKNERLEQPFEFLFGEEPETIARELEGEHPQTVAVILAHLLSAQAGEVLALLPKSSQVEVARRLSHLDEMDEPILHEIENGLKERFQRRTKSNAPQRRKIKGVSVMNDILGATDRNTQARILSELDRSRETKYRNENRVSFDDLEKLGNGDLATLFHSVDSKTAMLALVGAKPSLIERITKRFSPTEEYQMRRQLRQLGAFDEEDVRRARNAILEKAELLVD